MVKEPDNQVDMSYERHVAHYEQFLSDPTSIEVGKSWANSDTVDAWRHNRMYALLDPLLETVPGAHWLTIGDGRYGTDAHYLLSKGARALATDISDALLVKAHYDEYIQAYQCENAECLSFADASFDFVLCKESYHHFPRPMLGLYEMVRVTKQATILIEPIDFLSDSLITLGVLKVWRLKKRFAGMIKRARTDAASTGYPDSWEPVGNYVYTISKREMIKAALGLGLEAVAFRGLEDYYCSGVEYEKVHPASPLLRKIQRRIYLLEWLTRLHLKPPSLLAVILFKELPSEALNQRLLQEGFEMKHLQRPSCTPISA